MSGQEGAHRESSSHSGRMLQGTATPARERPGLARPHPAMPAPQSTLTLLEAVQGDGALANKVVLGGSVVILHHEAHEGKLRHSHLELKLRVPPGVETWGHRHHVSSMDTAAVAGPAQSQHAPLLVTTAVWRLATSRATPWISTVTLGSTIEFLFLLTFGSCCPVMT